MAFIILQKRWNIYPLLMFYVLSFVVILSRIGCYAATIRHYNRQPTDNLYFQVGSAFYFIAASAKLMIGLFQWATMLELKNQLRVIQ